VFLAAAASCLATGNSPIGTSFDSRGMLSGGNLQNEVEGYRRLAADAIARDNLELAETYYQHLLTVSAPDSAKVSALRELADVYEKRHDLAKTITVLEAIRQIAPEDDPTAPETFLRLGRLYREAGAYQTAIARYYSVLNAALRLGAPELGKYQDWTQQAQFEIAETYFASGDYAQANKFFALCGKLDLSREDKARALFRSAYCLFLLDDKKSAEETARRFLKDYGDTKYAPEGHYLLATTLRSLGRAQEAMEEVLSLLHTEQKVAESDPQTWARWQEKAGNQIANDLYLNGDFGRALSIYQALAKLKTSPDWLWPVIYQMGLCFERLLLPDRANEAYSFITDEARKSKGDSTQVLNQVVKMAAWRHSQLGWKNQTESRLETLLGGPDVPAAAETSPAP